MSGDLHEWRTISAEHESKPIKTDTYHVLFARKTDDGWEYGHESVSVDEVEDLEVLES